MNNIFSQVPNWIDAVAMFVMGINLVGVMLVSMVIWGCLCVWVSFELIIKLYERIMTRTHAVRMLLIV